MHKVIDECYNVTISTLKTVKCKIYLIEKFVCIKFMNWCMTLNCLVKKNTYVLWNWWMLHSCDNTVLKNIVTCNIH